MFDNSRNVHLKHSRAFQTFYGTTKIRNSYYLVFEYSAKNLNDVMAHHCRKYSNIREEILLKVLQTGFQGFMSCKKSKCYYPDISNTNFLVTNVKTSKKESLRWHIQERECKLTHPFMFSNFLKQLQRAPMIQSNQL